MRLPVLCLPFLLLPLPPFPRPSPPQSLAWVGYSIMSSVLLSWVFTAVGFFQVRGDGLVGERRSSRLYMMIVRLYIMMVW